MSSLILANWFFYNLLAHYSEHIRIPNDGATFLRSDCRIGKICETEREQSGKRMNERTNELVSERLTLLPNAHNINNHQRSRLTRCMWNGAVLVCSYYGLSVTPMFSAYVRYSIANMSRKMKFYDFSSSQFFSLSCVAWFTRFCLSLSSLCGSGRFVLWGRGRFLCVLCEQNIRCLHRHLAARLCSCYYGY